MPRAYALKNPFNKQELILFIANGFPYLKIDIHNHYSKNMAPIQVNEGNRHAKETKENEKNVVFGAQK